ncbi:hypothetical protein PSTT_09963 [Puccinia striiformis]|uniref:Uncharacterized protein n=1 Tax=Puccinia striiformis TaxID=27350 RepID=A0A2S4V6E4_9BASI|nr:hypothetical protein PSTT_09963 [Puccinia striiformis]
MSQYGVITAANASSHLPPTSVPLLENNSQHDQHHFQLRPNLSNRTSTSHPSPSKLLALTELTNRIKEEDKINNSEQPFQIVSSPNPEEPILGHHHHQRNQQATEIHPLDSYHYQAFPPSSSQHPQHFPQLNAYQEQHHTPPTSGVSYGNTLQSQSNRLSPLRSPNIPLPSHHHQQHHHHHHSQQQQQQQQPQQQHHHHQENHQQHQNHAAISALYTPYSDHTNSDLFQSSPTWSHSQYGDPIDLQHRNVSLSTPVSNKGLNSSDNTRNYSLSRLLTLPYQLDSPEPQPVCSSIDGYSLSSFGLPNLDGTYPFNGHPPVSQPYRLGSHHTQLKGLNQMNTSADHHHHPADYATRSPPPRLNQPCNLSSRLPSTPSDSFPSLLPSHLAQSAPEAQMGHKRKYEPDCFSETFSPKVARPSPGPVPSNKVSLNTVGLEPGHERMTTVLCLHASVAQKSYGQEKRFLCPPPLVRITGPYRQLPKSHRPVLSMSILNEDGQRHLCQTALLGEDESNVHFKSLHISGAAKKAKHVNLELSLHPPLLHDPKPLQNLGPDIEELMPPFATFRSSDCTIISKPSKKTAKARNTQSCIFNGSTICLFNRINSQTVRTKYLCVQDRQLAARAAQWSAFTIRVLRRAEEAGADGTPPMTAKTLLSSSIPGADRTVTYGSEVELVDFVTGVSSGPLIVRKVEKSMVQKDATGPVSQMQKLAFCQMDKPSGSALYISALEGVPLPAGSPPTNVTEPTSTPGVNPTQDGTDLSGLALGPALVHASPPSSAQTSRMLHMLQLQPPRATLPSEDPEAAPLDEIDDSVAWTVIGVAHFSHSFIDLSHYYPQIPHLPITPFPALTCRPQVDLHALTMSLRVSGFFDAHARSMEVWLGPIGALETKVSATSGLTLEPSVGDGGSNENAGPNGLRLQVSSDASNGWSSHRKGTRRESTLLVTLPPLESVYWTLHRKNMPGRSVVVLDESNRSMSELVGRSGDGGSKNDNGHLNNSNHIPALPITLIRADGISFVMGHSICLSEVNQEEQKENEDISKTPGNEPARSHTFILKVI